EDSTRAADKWKRDERLIACGPEHRAQRGERWRQGRGLQNYRSSYTARGVRRIRQVESGKVLRIVRANLPIRVGREEKFQLVVDADLKTHWNFGQVNIPRIAIPVAVGDAESKLALAQRISIVDRE